MASKAYRRAFESGLEMAGLPRTGLASKGVKSYTSGVAAFVPDERTIGDLHLDIGQEGDLVMRVNPESE